MKVAVFGAGYVGLVSGVGLASRGHEVVCVDIDPARVERLSRGDPGLHEPGLGTLLGSCLASGAFRVTASAEEALGGAAIAMIAVGTPDREGRIDLAFVLRAAETVGAHLRTRRDRVLVVVKSTVVPGSTHGPIRAALERASGKVAGEQFGLSMNPEFLREGSALADFMSPDRIVLGALDAQSAELLEKLYASFDCPKLRLTPTEAEFAKYVSNAFLATLISFSNEIFSLCEAAPSVSGRRVLESLHLDRRLSPPQSASAVRPEVLGYLMGGIGFGGSCLPKDLNALASLARDGQLPVPLLEAVIAVNQDRPRAIVARLATALGALSGRTVAVLGLAFKPGTDDWRESPSLPLIGALLDAGCAVRAWDPLVGEAALARFGGRVALARDAGAALAGADAGLIATAWPELKSWPWDALVASMATPLVLDGRNLLGELRWPAGTRYLPLGQGPVAAPTAGSAP